MKNRKKTLWILEGVLYAACVADGLLTMLGVPGMMSGWNLTLGNILSVVFFLPMAFLISQAYSERDEDPIRMVRLWSAAALLGSLVLLVVISFCLGAPVWVQNVLWGLWILVNPPVINCSIMVLPFFLWAVVLISAWMALKSLRGK